MLGVGGLRQILCRGLVCNLALLSAQIAKAGAWPVEAGHGQIISTSLFDAASTGYDENGGKRREVDFSKYEEAVFVEQALDEKWTFIFSSALQDVSYTAGIDKVSFSGLGETYIGVRRPVWEQGRSILSAQAGVLIAGSGESISDADLGVGKLSYETRLLAGHSFKFAKRDSFAELQIARRFRTGPYPNDWRLDATLGWQAHRNLQIFTQAFYTKTAESPELNRANTRLKLQGSFVLKRSKKTSWQLGGYETVAGKNSIRERAVFFAIWSRY